PSSRALTVLSEHRGVLRSDLAWSARAGLAGSAPSVPAWTGRADPAGSLRAVLVPLSAGDLAHPVGPAPVAALHLLRRAAGVVPSGQCRNRADFAWRSAGPENRAPRAAYSGQRQ